MSAITNMLIFTFNVYNETIIIYLVIIYDIDLNGGSSFCIELDKMGWARHGRGRRR